MKKLINKKVSLLGKEFSVLAIVAVMMIGLASAALVPYLSNAVTGSVDVDSPFTAFISSGDNPVGYSNATNVLLPGMVGGNTAAATLEFQYNGNQTNVEVKEIFTIASANITCDDFESITFDSGSGLNTVPSTWCDETVDGILTITDPGFNDYDSGEINLVKVRLNFKLNAKGTYALGAQIVPTTA